MNTPNRIDTLTAEQNEKGQNRLKSDAARFRVDVALQAHRQAFARIVTNEWQTHAFYLLIAAIFFLCVPVLFQATGVPRGAWSSMLLSGWWFVAGSCVLVISGVLMRLSFQRPVSRSLLKRIKRDSELVNEIRVVAAYHLANNLSMTHTELKLFNVKCLSSAQTRLEAQFQSQ